MFEARFYQAPLISSGHQNEWSLQMNLLPPHVYIWGSTPGALASCYELLFEGKIQREWRIRELGDNMAQISFRHSSETLDLLLFALHIDMQTYTCKYPFFPHKPQLLLLLLEKDAIEISLPKLGQMFPVLGFIKFLWQVFPRLLCHTFLCKRSRMAEGLCR